ncbi:heme ABC transporter ATP-binding protein [Marinobacter sediminicola]|uniref:heme ABC transporter ATP-binding protein n=1 Tax=Marinobacter sediminicola TaxID=3072994 RepID=UPI002810ABD8|nr:heme ABC transporter ATP-binding protein [Marinobacter sp. F26243]
MTVLKAKQLGLTIGRSRILQDVSLTVEPGELVALLGPNGAGKSSLLKTLAGELAFGQGTIELFGRSIQQWKGSELARQRAVMPQRVDVSFPFTVREIVALGCSGLAAAERNELIDYLLQRLGIGNMACRLVPTLSGGEQQRVQLARVLAQIWHTNGPRLLLLDECTSALDPAQQQTVFSLLRELAKDQGYSVVAVIHDLNVASCYADRLVMMAAGRIVENGAANTILEPGLLDKVFGLKARVLALPEGYPMVIPQA